MDDIVTGIDPDIAFALEQAPPSAREAPGALWALDAALGQVLATGTETMISRIRLAWWREALARLDSPPAPAEPVLQGLQAHVLPRGISGAALSVLADGWEGLLEEAPIGPEALALYARDRGSLLFRLSSSLLGAPDFDAAGAGAAWALVDLARHSANAAERDAAVALARDQSLPRRWARPVRPIGMLAALAQRDLKLGPERWEPAGAPPRRARMLRHLLLGW